MIIELNDAELVAQIGSGDPRAETELFRRMAPRIRLYGLRHLRDEHAAADLTQQVLITTLETLRAGRLRAPEKLASFVLICAAARSGRSACSSSLGQICSRPRPAGTASRSRATRPQRAKSEGAGARSSNHDVLR